MENKWYYVKDKQKLGPVSQSDLSQLFDSGSLSLDTLVFCEGMKNWQKASLRPEFAIIPPIPDGLPPLLDNYASFGQRLGAYFVDLAILFVVNMVLTKLLFNPNNIVNEVEAIANLMQSLMLQTIIGWAYFAIAESSEWQGSLGKKLVGIKVTDEEGQRISLGQATGRYFGKILSSLILLMGYFMVLWTPKKQALHDSLAKTVVTEK